MGQIVSVFGDKNSHGGGDLLCDNNAGKAFIGGKLIGLLGCTAAGDNQKHPIGTTNPSTASSKVFVGGIPAHRHGDMRLCGATTIASGSKVSCA